MAPVTTVMRLASKLLVLFTVPVCPSKGVFRSPKAPVSVMADVGTNNNRERKCFCRKKETKHKQMQRLSHFLSVGKNITAMQSPSVWESPLSTTESTDRLLQNLVRVLC